MITAGSFPEIMSERMSADAIALSAQWLERLTELLPVETRHVFPSDRILDHIPALIESIARYIQAPEHEEIAANTAVIDKARELGTLRHAQHASVHQILREFEILSEILEAFVVGEATRLDLTPSAAECFDTLRRITRATRALLRTTVDTFVAEYTAAIQERNERLRAFNRLASHELRTPLGTLMFAAAALDQPSVRSSHERMKGVTEAIRSNTARLGRLVENLQRIVRLSDSPDGPDVQEVEVGLIAQDVRSQIEDMAAARGVSIEIAPSLPSLVIDPARLELILINLMSNAIKYCDPAKPNPFVQVSCAEGECPDGHVRLLVRDNGLGVPDDLKEDIFERFTRAHAHLDETHGVSGAGLGLSIVAECVEAVGGRIRCDSTLGEGTVFDLLLPLMPPRPPAAFN
jgi:signal transduction histidine kinase